MPFRTAECSIAIFLTLSRRYFYFFPSNILLPQSESKSLSLLCYYSIADSSIADLLEAMSPFDVFSYFPTVCIKLVGPLLIYFYRSYPCALK
jgi:hypothetical protein